MYRYHVLGLAKMKIEYDVHDASVSKAALSQSKRMRETGPFDLLRGRPQPVPPGVILNFPNSP